ncbi:MAG: DNA polymerase III subunit delta' [Gammaproteobacteria bacterium]|nr:DNA polymerase III subunit delta' [Gammaproteobacteria bacterium]
MMDLEALTWHTPLWSRWCEAVASGRLGHAFLLVGQPGVGKQRLAARIAAGVLCEAAAQPPGEPCGRCRGCTLFLAGSHPDSVLVAAEEPGKSLNVDQIREMVGKVALTTHFAGSKVVRIEAAESMTLAASNALLKTLEEPPGRAVFILTSSRPSSLPITIRSRCQLWRVPDADRAQANAWLEEQGVAADLLEEAWTLAPGAPLAMLRLAQDDGLEQRRALLADAEALASTRLDVVSAAARWRALGASEALQGLQRIAVQLARSAILGTGQRGFEALDRASVTALYQALTEARVQLGTGAGGVNETLLLERVAALWLTAAGPRARSGQGRAPARPRR